VGFEGSGGQTPGLRSVKRYVWGRRQTHLKPDSLWGTAENTRIRRFKKYSPFFQKIHTFPHLLHSKYLQIWRGLANFLNDTEGGMLKI
jgi:hypothetical protein